MHPAVRLQTCKSSTSAFLQRVRRLWDLPLGRRRIAVVLQTQNSSKLQERLRYSLPVTFFALSTTLASRRRTPSSSSLRTLREWHFCLIRSRLGSLYTKLVIGLISRA